MSPEAGTFASDTNIVHLITKDGIQNWPQCSKAAVAERLASHIAKALKVAV